MLEKHFSELLNEVTQKGFFWDYKSRLQEYSQEKFESVPRYIVLAETGPDHKKTYDIQVLINDIPYENGRGRNKKAAEQEAAKRTLEKLLKQAP
jgi:ribonuclease-3